MATISKEKVSTAEVGKLLVTPENHFNDLKAKEIKPAKLSRTLAAFANAEGGELFVGISESHDRKTRTWQGFPYEEEANQHIQVFDELFPLGVDSSMAFSLCGRPLRLRSQDRRSKEQGNEARFGR